MKYCSDCGKPNRDEAKFCEHCGKRFEKSVLNIKGTQSSLDNESKYSQAKKSPFKINVSSFIDFWNSIPPKIVIFLGMCFGLLIIFSSPFLSKHYKDAVVHVKERVSAKEVNITNVILKEKTGIQEIAVAKSIYTIEKNKTKTQGLLLFDYVTQKFICDFHYRVKYGYDLASLTSSDITTNKENKTVKVRLPQGLLISNELIKMNVRHNEGVILDFNKVKAEDIADIQEEAKSEAAEQALSDEGLTKLAKSQMKIAVENTIHTVAPDYTVVIVGG